MEKGPEVKFQIGKAGLTDSAVESYRLAFKTHHQLRISVLKSAGRNRDNVKEIASRIQEKLGFSTAVRIMGFTIILLRIKHPRK